MSYPKTMYVASGQYGVLIHQRILLRETASYWVFAGRYDGSEDKVFKKSASVFPTFDEAKTCLLATKHRQMEDAIKTLSKTRTEVRKVEGLTKPTHVDSQVPMPQITDLDL